MDFAAIEKALEPLVEFPYPPEPSLWPRTPLALALLATLCIAGLWGAWRSLRHWRANRYRRQALAELGGIERRFAAGDNVSVLAALDDLLRRTALAAFPRRRVAALTGAEWRGFLDTTGGGFSGPVADSICGAPYRPTEPVPAGELSAAVAMARHWIEAHHD